MAIVSEVKQTNTVLAEYRAKLKSLENEIDSLRMRKLRSLAITGVGVVLGMSILLAGLMQTVVPMVGVAISVMAVIWGLRTFLQSSSKASILAPRLSFYERGIDRLEGKWRGKGSTGAEFARDHHLYQTDLQILGDGSLFEFICTTRTEIGAERLASFLLDAPTLEEARDRQEAVKELRDRASLREEIAALGNYQFQDCRGEQLREWLSQPILKVPRVLRIFLFFSGVVTLLLGLAGCVGMFPWSHIALLIVPIFALQAGICLSLMRRIRVHLTTLGSMSGGVSVLREGIDLTEHQPFSSAKLRKVAERLRSQNASATVQKLERLLVGIERRENPTLYAIALWLAAGTQLVLAVERWRAMHQSDFESWMDAWAEFEALNALGCYAWEHPENEFPELLDGGAQFEAEELCHPLLPAESCVGNDVALNGSMAFYVISGSNMAGKSTFLRAIGLNAVLASAGASVRAARLRTSVLHICASISIVDSLLEGRSKFLAEIERMRDSIRMTETGRPVLFLIDEILSGTNSNDRRIAAGALVGQLVNAGAIGALSTHDLALAEIATDPRLGGTNVHMQSDDPEEPLAFDYRVKPGISHQTNALAIVRMVGIPIDSAP